MDVMTVMFAWLFFLPTNNSSNFGSLGIRMENGSWEVPTHCEDKGMCAAVAGHHANSQRTAIFEVCWAIIHFFSTLLHP